MAKVPGTNIEIEEITPAVSERARARGLADELSQPRVNAASYDRAADRVVLNLVNGPTVTIPRAMLAGVAEARPDQLDRIDIYPTGIGFVFADLNVDFAVMPLLAQVLKLGLSPATFARQGGLAKSAVKTAAVRANGAKGGRPKKQAVSVNVVEHAVDDMNESLRSFTAHLDRERTH